MRFVSQRAYLQLFIALALGVAFGFQWPLPSALLLNSGVWIWLTLLALGGLAWLWHGSNKPSATVLLFAITAISGFLSVSLELESALGQPLRAIAPSSDYLRGTVASIPKYQKEHWSFLLNVDRVRVNGEWTSAPGRVYAYVKSPIGAMVYYRERITLRCQTKEVQPPGNRGQFNYRRYLLQHGTVLTSYAPSALDLHHLRPHPPQPWAAITRLRARLLTAVTTGLPMQLGQLAASVTYGDKVTELPEELQERFRRAGLTHILVASGTQISLLIGVLGLLLWRIGDSATWRGKLLNAGKFVFTLVAVLVYGAVTGFETSIVRALVMGVVVLIGQLSSREADGLTALAQAGLAVLVLSPLQLMSPGFQLSFGATFGLIYGAGVAFPLVVNLTGWRHALAQMLITTAGAQLFVAPVLAAQFNQMSAWGLLSNFLAIPLAFALLVIGGLASFGIVWVPVVGTLLRWVVLALSWLLNEVAAVFAALPGSNIAVPTPPLWWLLACYALLFCTGEWIKTRRAGPLPQRSTRLLRAAVPGLALLLAAPAMCWLLVPQPELAQLALPGAQAWLWRSADGHSVLLLRHAGLTRSHNLDTLESSLRCRGVNKLAGVVWLDGATDDSPLPDYPAPALTRSANLATCDLQFLSQADGSTVLRAATRGAKFDLAVDIDGRAVQASWQGNSAAIPPDQDLLSEVDYGFGAGGVTPQTFTPAQY